MLGEDRRILLVAKRLAGIDQDLRVGHHSGADDPRSDQLRSSEEENRGHDKGTDDASDDSRPEPARGRLF
jgi:hypothetical protein